jgi:hypothetical protein
MAYVTFPLRRLVLLVCGEPTAFLSFLRRELLSIAAVTTSALQQAQTWPRRIFTLLSPTLGGAALFEFDRQLCFGNFRLFPVKLMD